MVTALILGIIGALPGDVIPGLTIKAKADGSSVSFNEATGELTLKAGNIVKADVRAYRDNANGTVNSVVAEAGAVLPADSSELFSYFQASRIDLTGVDSSNVTNMNHMFYDCSNLSTIDVSGFDTSKVTDMSSMFLRCSSLSTLDLSGFDTSNVTDMSYMFNMGNNNNLQSLDLSSFDTSKVTNMKYMFYACTELTDLNISGFNTSKVTNMRGMFGVCEKLSSLDVSSFETSRVTDMSNMFYCVNADLDLSGFDTRNVTDMSNMFYGYGGTTLDLSSFVLHENVDARNMFMFSDLMTIYVSNAWDPYKIGDGDSMFALCRYLEGGNGTSYASAGVENKSYARIDRDGTPGYLTEKNVTKYKVIFNKMDGSETIKSEVNENEKVAKPADPTKTGCTFDKWVKSDGNEFDFDTQINSNTFLYATWRGPELVSAVAPQDCETPGNIKHYRKDGKLFIKHGNKYIEVTEKDLAVTIPHTVTPVTASAATCTTDGNDPYYECSSCHKKFTDQACTNEITGNSYIRPAAHTPVPVDGKPATCTTDGNIAYYKCSSCHKKFADQACTNEITDDSWRISAIPTAHAPVPVDGKPATCTTDGNDPYYECSSCHKKFTDQACTNEITDDSWRIPAAHSLEPVTGSPATCTSDGTKAHFRCTVCGELFTDDTGLDASKTTLDVLKINKLGHHYVNGKCDRCGADDPDYTPDTVIPDPGPIIYTPDPTPAVTPEPNPDNYTKTIKNSDGSTTTRTVSKSEDGSTTTTEKTVYPGGKTVESTTVKQEDGSFTTNSKTTDASGNILSTTSIVSSIDTAGVTTCTTDTYNADGTSLNSILKTSAASEVLYSYIKEVKLDRKGSIVVTSDTLKENGTKVSKIYKADGNGVKVSSFKSDKGTVTIPSTITIAGHKVPVTTIAGGAFKSDLTLTKVKIGKNVNVIGKNAFNGAKNLKSIVIYGDLTEVHKGAFKGIAPDAVIKIKADKENFGRIVAMIKASGISKTVKFKRVK